MNKKILLSLALVAVASAAAIGGTIAFFSDTETSVGNTFTAGAIDLRVDSQCTYNGQESEQCGEWELKDLGTNFDQAIAEVPTVGSDRFYNFSDVKPGDFGENTISLHVRNNEAHACLIVDNLHNDDLGLTEPESEDGDETDGADNGELAQAIKFFAWDDDGDNVWGTGELPLFTNTSGPASDVLNGRTYYLGVLPGGEWNDPAATQYIGVYWCYGDITVDATSHTLSCSGASVNNVTQTDQLTADIKFYVEQTRHNQNFRCPEKKEIVFEEYYNTGKSAANKALDRPYIESEINGDTITFDFVNPTNFFFAFDYRIDGETVNPLTGGGVPGPWAAIVIGEGELNGQVIGNDYHVVTVAPHTTQTRDVTGTEEIWAGLRQGAEQNWYLDWIKFHAVEL
ncbi:hypothetical protein A2619_05670 [candidate division WWE3 bacterium RIFOXYD1_FULL_39_9]|uniref:Camelysin metallo-endopeptidase n=1 Tax=candidate division WWE3 bacterium RIFOXYD1_FULL_39_9 TaxID=1802649 RepID=A0A1F4X9C3_UNCKA|nr:MAG: hypothetical protein A2619_05670 [candidate division WWE3 bacterium RIFOXYD1_FULL_39_9]